MAWDGNYKEGSISSLETHIQHVYKDPDFAQAIEVISPQHNLFLKKVMLSDHEQKLHMVKIMQHDLDIEEIRRVATYYGVAVDDIYFYLKGEHLSGRVRRDRHSSPFRISSLDVDNVFTVKIKSEIIEDDFMEIWKIILSNKRKLNQGKVPKPKPAHHDKLLYAIFKEKQKGSTFPTIFNKYQNNELDYYKKLHFNPEKKQRFTSQQSLSNYYYKNQPKPPPLVDWAT
jgi:DNA-binding protein H-NS